MPTSATMLQELQAFERSVAVIQVASCNPYHFHCLMSRYVSLDFECDTFFQARCRGIAARDGLNNQNHKRVGDPRPATKVSKS